MPERSRGAGWPARIVSVAAGFHILTFVPATLPGPWHARRLGASPAGVERSERAAGAVRWVVTAWWSGEEVAMESRTVDAGSRGVRGADGEWGAGRAGARRGPGGWSPTMRPTAPTALAALAALAAAGCSSDGLTDGPDPGDDVEPAAFVLVSAGEAHTCAVDLEGRAWCWGAGADGRLGTGAEADRVQPARVLGSVRFVQLSAGAAHTCGVDDAGDVWCWGAGADGRLGTGSAEPRLEPARVAAGGAVFERVTAGAAHTCALDEAGAAWCWGAGAEGRLGTGGTEARMQPTRVAGNLLFGRLSAGAAHTCAVERETAAAWCWGGGADGRLGHGSEGDRLTPDRVLGGLAWAAVSAGEAHTCGVASDGRILCWGAGAGGRLGNGAELDRLSPADVSGGQAFGLLTAGGAHSCALTGAGVGWCWGSGANGRLGNGAVQDRLSPARVSGT